MMCPKCGKEMYRDRVVEDGNKEVNYFKCPDPACLNYGYAKETIPGDGAKKEGDAGA